jgi:hypothetical protein
MYSISADGMGLFSKDFLLELLSRILLIISENITEDYF